MTTFSRLASLSSLPIVNLRDISCPMDGILVGRPAECARKFAAGEKCREHYERLARDIGANGQLVECPYGFATMAIRTQTQHIALTGVIPFPRLGSCGERSAARRNPKNKISRSGIEKAAETIKEINMKLLDVEQQTIQGQAVALHEIRKLNRTVKQNAERLCMRQNKEYPEMADVELVNIWKSAEIMSTQFDVIELVANEGLASLPLNSEIEVYRIFDKCTRIYRPRDNSARINMSASTGFIGRIRACDKTFPMIPTVLIENALKFSAEDTEVRVRFDSAKGKCSVVVSNCVSHAAAIGPENFQKGFRGTDAIEGSGLGLYVAQLVAKQHNSEIAVAEEERGGRRICLFRVEFDEIR